MKNNRGDPVDHGAGDGLTIRILIGAHLAIGLLFVPALHVVASPPTHVEGELEVHGDLILEQLSHSSIRDHYVNLIEADLTHFPQL